MYFGLHFWHFSLIVCLFVCRRGWTDSSPVLCKLVCCVSYCVVWAHVTCTCDCSLPRGCSATQSSSSPVLLFPPPKSSTKPQIKSHLSCYCFWKSRDDVKSKRNRWVWEAVFGAGRSLYCSLRWGRGLYLEHTWDLLAQCVESWRRQRLCGSGSNTFGAKWKMMFSRQSLAIQCQHSMSLQAPSLSRKCEM